MAEKNGADMNTGAPATLEINDGMEFASFESEANAAEAPAPTSKPEDPKPQAEEKTDDKPAATAEEEVDPDAGETPPDESGEARGAPKKTFQERINELTRKQREAERRAEAAERELAQSRVQREQPAPKPGEAGKPAATTEDGAPKPPDPDDFEFGELDSRYVAAVAQFTAKQAVAEFQAEQRKAEQERREQATQRERAEKAKTRIEAGSKVYDDFYEKVVVGAEKLEWPLSDTLGALVVESDVGEHIAYHLATHPEEAAQVYGQSPTEQARYFGRMEAKFSAAESAASGQGVTPAEETQPAKTPKAPPPVTPARGTGGRFQATADSDDFAEFEKAAASRE